jgi:beta-galactosidase
MSSTTPDNGDGQKAATAVERGALKPPHVRKELPRPESEDSVVRGERVRFVASLNQGWRFRLAAAEETEPLAAIDGSSNRFATVINLPHSVRLEPLNASGGRNYQGLAWYCRTLRMPAAWQGKIVYLRFEGAMQTADVWMNGRKLFTHHCGYLPFTVDITHCSYFGERINELAVRLDNRDNPQVPPGKPQRELDFTYFGGLYRDVCIEAVDRLHISDPMLENKAGGGGIFVTYPKVSPHSATVNIRTHVVNENGIARHCTVGQELIDGRGVVAAARVSEELAAGNDHTFKQNLEVLNPLLWHPNHPNLYTLHTVVYDGKRLVDDHVTRIGIRQIHFDRKDGFSINGEPFMSIGGNRHQDHPYVGYALPASADWRDVKKLREAGFTSFRSHYPQSPAFMDACDEFGMLTIVSNPGWQFVGDEVFRDRVVKNARSMVRRDRNRPSVILWEAALNESNNASLGEALQQAIHEEFPGDQCFTAGDHEPGFSWKGVPGWDLEYLHNDGTKPYWIREWGDHVDNWSDQQSRSRVPRAWGESPMHSQARSHLARLDEIMRDRVRKTENGETQRLCGACLWAAIDCQRGYHHNPFHGGVFDLFRLPKFSHFLFQSQRPAHIHAPGLNDGPMVFIANFATFLSPQSIIVFSNCQEVRLAIDGQQVAQQKPDSGHFLEHPPFTFHIPSFLQEQTTMYMTGVVNVQKPPQQVRAEGLIGGKVAAAHVVMHPGVARKLELEADLCGRDLAADGSDWVRVYARITDANGCTCPFANDLVRFEVDGEASLIGDFTIGANPVHAEAGIATVLVQASTRPGLIRVTASAFGLTSGAVEITSRPPVGKMFA